MTSRDHAGALTGRVAVVTGSSRGIGRALVLDAAMQILTSEPRTCTGRMVTDEEILTERGWSAADLDSYWLTGTPPESPLWIDGRPSREAS